MNSLTGKSRKYSVTAITVLLLYTLVPSESNGGNFALFTRCTAAALLIAWMLINGIRRTAARKVAVQFGIVAAIMLFSLLISFSLRAVISFLALAVAYFWSVNMVARSRVSEELLAGLSALMYFSCAVLLVQLILYALGSFVPFHQFVFPWSEARVQFIGDIWRMGGFYIEPGTFSNWMYSFFLLNTISSGRISPVLGIVTACSLILTVSAWGVVVGLLLMLFLLLSSLFQSAVRRGDFSLRKRMIQMAFGFGVIIALLAFFNISDLLLFLNEKFSFQTTSGASKVDVIQMFSRDWYSFMAVGEGFDPGFCSSCEHVADAGLGLNLAVVYGIPIACAFVVVVVRGAARAVGWPFAILVLPLFSTKIPSWDFVPFLILGSVFAARRATRDQRDAERIPSKF